MHLELTNTILKDSRIFEYQLAIDYFEKMEKIRTRYGIFTYSSLVGVAALSAFLVDHPDVLKPQGITTDQVIAVSTGFIAVFYFFWTIGYASLLSRHKEVESEIIKMEESMDLDFKVYKTLKGKSSSLYTLHDPAGFLALVLCSLYFFYAIGFESFGKVSCVFLILFAMYGIVKIYRRKQKIGSN